MGLSRGLQRLTQTGAEQLHEAACAVGRVGNADPGFRTKSTASCLDPGWGQPGLAEGVAADAGFHADVDLDVALGAGFGEAARFGLFDFDFELALGTEFLGAGGVGEVNRALGMDAVAGERWLAADGAEFASGLGGDDRFWFENAHMAPISDGWRSVVGGRTVARGMKGVSVRSSGLGTFIVPDFALTRFAVFVGRFLDEKETPQSSRIATSRRFYYSWPRAFQQRASSQFNWLPALAATAAGAVFLRAGFVDGQGATVEVFAVEAVDGGLGFIVV
jgi:hypothetical protein